MRIVVTGATRNVGTSVVKALAGDRRVDEIVAVARRAPARRLPGARFVSADVAESELVSIFRGADVVVHLAWLIQPGRDEAIASRVKSSRQSWPVGNKRKVTLSRSDCFRSFRVSSASPDTAASLCRSSGRVEELGDRGGAGVDVAHGCARRLVVGLGHDQR